MLYLMIGTLALVAGVGVSLVQLVQFVQEQQARVKVPRNDMGERLFSLVFLGAVPALAGMVFLATWWQDRAPDPAAYTNVPPAAVTTPASGG